MKKVAVVTDSNSGITQEEAKELGVYVLPMPFFINGESYLEGVTITQEEFYKKLAEDADISTSQPAPADITDLWDKVLEEYDELVCIPMSSGLSGTCSTSYSLSEDYEGRVEVVDNQRISVTQRQSVLDAMELIKRGLSAAEVKQKLLDMKKDSSIYITLETLKYLKKGGRITPAAAAIGTVLNLKPVLQIQGEKLDAYAKVRGKKAARRTMIEAIRKDLEGRFVHMVRERGVHIHIAYTGNYEEAMDWKKEVLDNFSEITEDDIIMDPLSLSVSCHIGAGALAIACSIGL